MVDHVELAFAQGVVTGCNYSFPRRRARGSAVRMTGQSLHRPEKRQASEAWRIKPGAGEKIESRVATVLKFRMGYGAGRHPVEGLSPVQIESHGEAVREQVAPREWRHRLRRPRECAAAQQNALRRVHFPIDLRPRS